MLFYFSYIEELIALSGLTWYKTVISHREGTQNVKAHWNNLHSELFEFHTKFLLKLKSKQKLDSAYLDVN